MTMISDLSWDLVEEILYRVPITSLGAMRSTCKGWRSLSKDPSYTKKHYGKAAKEYLVNKTWGNSFSCGGWYGKTPMRFSLHNIEDLPSTKEIGKVICPVDTYEVYQCDGLFLCVTTNKESNIVVWNPYTSQTRLIESRNVSHGRTCQYAIGYDNSNNHKVLRFFYLGTEIVKFEIYDFNSSSWRVLDITINFYTHYKGVSLKGNTYFVCKEVVFCFDFTTERFGQRLSLPFDFYGEEYVVPSRVREEQLAVLQLLQRRFPRDVEIWITTTIEPNAVSWSKYFKVKFPKILSLFLVRSFFIDNEEKVVVVCGTHYGKDTRDHEASYVIGEDVDYQKTSFIGEVSSYVPSSVLIQ